METWLDSKGAPCRWSTCSTGRTRKLTRGTEGNEKHITLLQQHDKGAEGGRANAHVIERTGPRCINFRLPNLSSFNRGRHPTIEQRQNFTIRREFLPWND